jgi:hypothetical protein
VVGVSACGGAGLDDRQGGQVTEGEGPPDIDVGTVVDEVASG